MILLLGASGYIGSAFALELNRRGLRFEAHPRKWLNYSRYDVLHHYCATMKPEFIINCAGYTGRPNVDACEAHKTETFLGNVALPQTISHVCASLKIPWLHVSSGCIYNGPGPYSELDPPNFTFRERSSTYCASKALAEEIILQQGDCYVCRLRIPFDEQDNPRNYLSKLQRYPKAYQATNSISQRGDLVKACLDLWSLKAPFGIYNMTNPGVINTRQVVMMIHTILRLDREWDFFLDDAEFYSTAALAPRSNCTLDVSKLAEAGVVMRTVEEALQWSLQHWRRE